MALLNLTPPEKAEGKLAELYAQTQEMFGAVPNNVRMLGVSPAVLENQLDFAGYYMGHGSLSFPFLAELRMAVAKRSESPYCLGLNAMLLKRAGFTDDQVEAAKVDPNRTPFSDKEKALLSFVLNAIKDPHSVQAKDVEQMKSLGWSEQDIFDAVTHGARAIAASIVFDTFKVEPDQF